MDPTSPTDRFSPLAPRPARLLDCDLVMKGGITSGLVYPHAVVRIAREYRVRNVGGTSVGAIAAALTAAAEVQRQRCDDPAGCWSDDLDGSLFRALDQRTPVPDSLDDVATKPDQSPSGYAGLHAIPEDIGDDLLGKFQPDPPTSGVFSWAIRIMTGYSSKPGKVIAALFLGLWGWRVGAAIVGVLLFGLIGALDPTAVGRFALIAGLVVGIALVALLRRRRREPVDASWVIAAIGTAVALLVARLVWVIWTDDTLSGFLRVDRIVVDSPLAGLRDGWQDLVVGLLPFALLFWIAGGVAALTWAVVRVLPLNDFGLCSGMGDAKALTPWLHARLASVAGLAPGTVLTFGHLEPTDAGEEAGPAGRRVGLVMIATDVVRGVPLHLPRALPRRYLFHPDEMGRFFPPEVVRALIADGTPDAAGRYPFPQEDCIPVLVTARMSMSFPVLFRAVPVWYRDGEGEVHRTWLSDGGIVSNFPSNTFDRALPPWPTFGLDLVDVGETLAPDTPPDDQHMRRWLIPTRPYTGTNERGNPDRLPTTAIAALPAFLMGAVNAARGWMDNSQKRLPGYAERIVAIKIYPGEGGLNLNMDAARVRRLARRGLIGADRLIAQWSPDAVGSQWQYHRWVRLRTLMREMEEIGREWATWYQTAPLPDVALPDDPGIPSRTDGPGTFAELTDNMPVGATPSAQMANTGTRYPFPWRSDADRASATALIAAFDAFAQATSPPAALAEGVQEGGGAVAAAGDRPVFDAPDSPSPNPTFLLMPPYV